MSENYYYSISRDDYRKKKTITIGRAIGCDRNFIIIPDYRDNLKQELLGLLGFTLIASFFITVLVYTFIPSDENRALINAMLIGLTVVIATIVFELPFVPFKKKVTIIGKKINNNVCTMEDLLLIKDHVPDKFDSCLDAIRDFEETESIKTKDFIESTMMLAQVRKNNIKENKLNNVDFKWEFEENIVKQEISIVEEIRNINSKTY